MSLCRVQRDDPEYQRLAAAEMDFWSKPHPFGLESLETIESGGPVDRYNNKRFTGDARIPWYETIPRYGTFRRGLVLGTSAITVEGRILATNPSLHLIASLFVDRANQRDLARVIFLDEDINRKIAIVTRITGRDVFGQFPLGLARRLDLTFD